MTCLFISEGHAQNYYVERFNVQADGTTSDADNSPWTTTQGSSGTLDVYSFYGEIQANSVSTEAVWTSGSINISGSTSISVDVYEYDDAESSDYVRLYYKLDGSSTEVEFGNYSGNFSNATATTTITGSSVVIVARFLNNFERQAIDNIVVQSTSTGAAIYSIASGDWDNGSSWSTTGFAGSACNCYPNGSTTVNVGNSRTINLNVDADVNDITIENTGAVFYTAPYVELNIVDDGVFTINSGGTFDENGQTYADIDFEGLTGTSGLVVNAGATFTPGWIFVQGGNTVNITGDGDINLVYDFYVSAGTVNNNSTGTFTIGDYLVFDEDNTTFNNNGTVVINDDILAGAGDDGNTIAVGSGASLTIGGDIDLSGSSMTINSNGVISQAGNFLNIGASSSFNNLSGSFWFWSYTGGVAYDADMPNVFTAGGAFRYTGTGDQLVIPLSYNNLGIAGSGTKFLQGNTSVSGILYFTSGFLALGNYDLTTGNTSSINNASSARFVVVNGTGSLIQNNIGTGGKTGGVLFPVGISSTSYTPLTINNTGTADNFSVSVCSNIYEEGGCGTGTMASAEVVNRTWFINEAVVGGSNATLTFQWNATNELTGFDRTNLNIIHHNGSYWNAVGNLSAAGAGPYTGSVSGITSFSPFGIEGGSTPLPVQLLFFKAEHNDDKIKLLWETASELNNDFFTIERTTDLKVFDEITTVDGSGTTENSTKYHVFDYDPLMGTAYYRLKQTDFDGSYSYSDLVKVTNSYNKSQKLQLYPVPNDGISINISNPAFTEGDQYWIHVIDINGRIVYKEQKMIEAGSSLLLQFKQSLSPGVYTLLLESGELQRQTFVVK